MFNIHLKPRAWAILLLLAGSVCLGLSIYLAVVSLGDRGLSDFAVCTKGALPTNVQAVPIPTPTYSPILSSDMATCDAWWQHIAWSAALGAIAAFLLLYLLITIASGQARILSLVIGTDRKLSVSQLQFVTWTFVLILVYPFLYVARMLVEAKAFHFIVPFPTPPTNVLIAVGLGAFTAVAATGIATGAAGSSNPSPPVQPTPSPKPATADPAPAAATTIPLHFRDLITNDSGLPDFTKLQMLGWTAVAAALYLGNVVLTAHGFALWDSAAAAGTKGPAFPDIPDALMWLMGFSQAAYLGTKYLGGSSPGPAPTPPLPPQDPAPAQDPGPTPDPVPAPAPVPPPGPAPAPTPNPASVPTAAEAEDAVRAWTDKHLQMRAIAEGQSPRDTPLIFRLDQTLEAGSTLSTIEGPILSPNPSRFAFFVDHDPRANWEHWCSYVFVADDKSVSVVDSTVPLSESANVTLIPVPYSPPSPEA